jgi:hypothetical protein
MIKNWNLFKESNLDEKSKIIELCKKYDIENYTINDDLSIDVDGNVIFHNIKLKEIPLKFNRVSGYFNCRFNKLTSLYNSPQWVGGNFYCYNNKLTSLEYLPKYIGGDIHCDGNKIWSFGGIPDNFRGELYCSGNPIANIWKLFESVKDIEFFNDCHIIREPENSGDLPIVVIERLNYFLETIGEKKLGIKGYNNI